MYRLLSNGAEFVFKRCCVSCESSPSESAVFLFEAKGSALAFFFSPVGPCSGDAAMKSLSKGVSRGDAAAASLSALATLHERGPPSRPASSAAAASAAGSRLSSAFRLNGEENLLGPCTSSQGQCELVDGEASAVLLRSSLRQLQRSLVQNAALSDALKFCLTQEERMQSLLRKKEREQSVATLSCAEAVRARDELSLKVQKLEAEAEAFARVGEAQAARPCPWP